MKEGFAKPTLTEVISLVEGLNLKEKIILKKRLLENSWQEEIGESLETIKKKTNHYFVKEVGNELMFPPTKRRTMKGIYSVH